MTDDDAELFSAAVPLDGARWDPNRMPDEAVAFDDALAHIVALSRTHPDPRPGGPTGWATAQALALAQGALRS